MLTLHLLSTTLLAMASTPNELWVQRQPESFPPARFAGAATYDPNGERMLLFGGKTVFGEVGDLWAWDGDSWMRVEITGQAPAGRIHATFTFHEASGHAVLFGGRRGDGAAAVLHGNTWLFDGDAWQLHDGASPEARTYAAAAYDEAHERVVLFGGLGVDASGVSKVYGDTWLWDGSSWSRAATSGPSERTGAVMAFDTLHQRVILFGGQVPRGTDLLGDTWAWNGKAWQQLTPATSPEARINQCMASDPERQRIILFGGQANIDTPTGPLPRGLDDTWEWDGETWQQVELEGSPGPRDHAAAVFDESHLRFTVTGGRLPEAAAAPKPLDDTWDYLSKRSHLSCSASGPAGWWLLLPLLGMLRRRRAAHRL